MSRNWRHEKAVVADIGTELALPFIVAYCNRWGLPYNIGGVENVQWWGAFDIQHNALRAVLGLSVIPPMVREVLEDDADFFVYGIYGDETLGQERAIAALIRALHALPCTLVGTIFLPNEKMYHAMRRRGWQFAAVLPKGLAHVLRRMPNIETAIGASA